MIENGPLHGFGRAVACGLRHMSGDAAVIMMADESDDCRNVVRYWNGLIQGCLRAMWVYQQCPSGKRFGMDLNSDVVEKAAPGVSILAQGSSQPRALADNSLDIVFTSNFFEHLDTKRKEKP